MDFELEKVIVQLMIAGETKVIATVLAMRDRRVMTDDAQTGFTYFQRSPDGPAALKSWYYAGDNWGEVFVYPRSKAVVIAKVTHEDVIATPAESAPTLKSEIVVVKPEEPLKPMPQPAVKAPEPIKVAEAPPPPPVARDRQLAAAPCADRPHGARRRGSAPSNASHGVRARGRSFSRELGATGPSSL